MHEAVTNTSTSTKNFLSPVSDDSQTPISRTHHHHPADNFSWSQEYDSDGESTLEVRALASPATCWTISSPS